MRATFDPAVVSEWTRRRVTFRHKSRWLWWILTVLLILATLPVVAGIIPTTPWLSAEAFCGVAFALVLRFRYLAVLKCPHCGRRPVRPGQRLPLWDVDCCPHCYYWLINPRRGG
jgi:hypothetical protein